MDYIQEKKKPKQSNTFRSMTDRQRIHIGMINSYNVLTKKAKFVDVVESSVPLFAHLMDGGLRKKDIDMMIEYFKEIEEYEKCIELSFISTEWFNDDGSVIQKPECECDMPSFGYEYNDDMVCSTCNKRLFYERDN